MLIGYGKIGRSMPLSLNGCGTLGGDVECVSVVKTLAERHPDDTFILLGRNSGEHPGEVGLPENIINPWIEWQPRLREHLTQSGMSGRTLSIGDKLKLRDFFRELTEAKFVECDAHVWWMGQHGTTNVPLPRIGDPHNLTKPQEWCTFYAAFALLGINAWREIDPLGRSEIYLNADPRNWLKMRDLKWPLVGSVITQYNFIGNIKHARYGDERTPEECGFGALASVAEPGVWRSRVRNAYCRLEVNGLVPGSPFGDLVKFDDTWEGRGRFGLFINEAGALGSERLRRITAMREWINPMEPDWVHGTWSKKSLETLQANIVPAPWDEYYPKLHSVHSTFTTPSSCSGWATTKPWEAFAAGTVCFFHPEYDRQNHILADAPLILRNYLRVQSLEELRRKVAYVHSQRDFWTEVITAQRRHFDQAMEDLTYMKEIERRIYADQ